MRSRKSTGGQVETSKYDSLFRPKYHFMPVKIFPNSDDDSKSENCYQALENKSINMQRKMSKKQNEPVPQDEIDTILF